jgi:SnoaL-like domain
VTPTSENPNIALVQRFFVAYAEHDLETMREEILAPDVTWRIPGHHSLAGVKRGADEILAYFGGSGLRSSPHTSQKNRSAACWSAAKLITSWIRAAAMR